MLIHNVLLDCTLYRILYSQQTTIASFSLFCLLKNLLVRPKHRLVCVPNFVSEPFENSQHIDGFNNKLNFRYLFNYYSAIVFADDYRRMPARNL